MDDLIDRAALLAEYDRRHQGPPDGARKMIEEFPSAWKHADTCPPKESGTYLAIAESGNFYTLPYSVDYAAWNVRTSEDLPHKIKVKWWMELPKPPKEES